MQIFIKNFNGKSITLDVNSEDTVLKVKNMFLKKEKISSNPLSIRFIHQAKSLVNNKTLKESNVKKDSTILAVYKMGITPEEEKFSLPQNITNIVDDKIENLIMRVINADPGEKSVVVIPGSVLGTHRNIRENLVTSDSDYYNKHDLFRQQLPLPILQEAYNSNKNVHIFLIDPEFNLSVNALNDVRNIFNNIDANNSMIFSEESSDEIDEHIGFYLEETYEIFKEIKLTGLEYYKEKELYVYIYILPFTISINDINQIRQMLQNLEEYYIYLHPSASASPQLTNREITTNSSNIRNLKIWHENLYDYSQNAGGLQLTEAGKDWIKAASKDMIIRTKTPEHYTSGLSKKDKKKQQRYLKRSSKDYKQGKYIPRPKLKSFKSKESNWTKKFKKKYGENVKTYKQISKVTGIPQGALKAVVKKGMGAYYSSGSRPNQTAESWGKARMYSYIMGGPTRKVDNHITEKHNVKF